METGAGLRGWGGGQESLGRGWGPAPSEEEDQAAPDPARGGGGGAGSSGVQGSRTSRPWLGMSSSGSWRGRGHLVPSLAVAPAPRQRRRV